MTTSNNLSSVAVTNRGMKTAVVEGGFSAAVAIGRNSEAIASEFQSASVGVSDRSTAIARGQKSVAAVLGTWSNAKTDGEFSVAVVTNHGSVAYAVENSIAVALHDHSRAGVAGDIGSWLILSVVECNEFDERKVTDVKVLHVDGKTIKANTKYSIRNGTVVEGDIGKENGTSR